MSSLSHQPDRFKPAEDLLHSFSFFLTDRVSRLPYGSAIDRTGSVRGTRHSASVTTWTHSPFFAAKGQNTIVMAVTATEPEKAVFRNSASQVVPELPLINRGAGCSRARWRARNVSNCSAMTRVQNGFFRLAGNIFERSVCHGGDRLRSESTD